MTRNSEDKPSEKDKNGGNGKNLEIKTNDSKQLSSNGKQGEEVQVIGILEGKKSANQHEMEEYWKNLGSCKASCISCVLAFGEEGGIVSGAYCPCCG